MATFVVVGAVAVLAALGVVLARNVVHSVLWLILHLVSLAVLYETLSAPFLGLVQVLLYAGAVMVLFLFVIGLLSTRGEAQVPRTGDRATVAVAVAAGIVATVVLLLGAAGGAYVRVHGPLPDGWGGAGSFGAALFGPYLLPFEATALALLTGVVGVVALAHGHDVTPAAPPPAPERGVGEPVGSGRGEGTA